MQPLIDGRVTLRGEPARCEVAESIPDSFRRMMRDDSILAGEMSFGFQTIVASTDARSRFVAIPVFPSRSFRHGNVFVRQDSRLRSFAELRGARVALEEYAMTMAVWVRRLFESEGVAPSDIQWFTGRDPVVVPEVEEALRQSISIRKVEGESIWALLERGEVDVVIGRPPDYRDVEGGAYRRLLADHWKVQRNYYARTLIFPIMHVLVVRRDAYEADPSIAVDLYRAFNEAKQLTLEDMATNLNALSVSLPMLEAHVSETRRLFGHDWWPYGMAPNRRTIEAFLDYCHGQNLVPRRVEIEDLFCANTLSL